MVGAPASSIFHLRTASTGSSRLFMVRKIRAVVQPASADFFADAEPMGFMGLTARRDTPPASTMPRSPGPFDPTQVGKLGPTDSGYEIRPTDDPRRTACSCAQAGSRPRETSAPTRDVSWLFGPTHAPSLTCNVKRLRSGRHPSRGTSSNLGPLPAPLHRPPITPRLRRTPLKPLAPTSSTTWSHLSVTLLDADRFQQASNHHVLATPTIRNKPTDARPSRCRPSEAHGSSHDRA